MFDLFRSRARAVRYLLGALLGLVALSLVITLIPGYGTPSQAPEQVLAEVGDQQITIRQVQMQIQGALRGKQVPSEMIQFYVPQIIDQMISERAIAYQAERMGFKVTDEELANAIRSMLVQYFPSGDIPRDQYQRFLGQQNLTVTEFERNVRSNLLLLKLQNIALEGAIVTPQEVENEYRRRNDQIKVSYVAYAPKDLRSEVNVTPEEVQKFYNGNKQQFNTQEKRDVVLLIADEAKIGASVQLSDEQLKAEYSKALDRYRTPERVKVRHILLKTEGKSPEEQKKLEAQANDLLKQIRAGADFGELAKKHSEDTGSAVNGGELPDWVTRGQMVKNFEEAAFTRKPKELGDVVKTEYGFHIVQVLDKEEARVRPFEEVKAQLATEAKREAVYARMQQAADQARAELAKNPQQAEAIAARHGLGYYRAEKVGKGESLPEIGTNAEMESALQGLRAGESTPVVQVAPTKLAVAAVTELYPSRPAEFAEVQNEIRDRLIAERVNKLTEQRLQDASAKFKTANGDLQALAKQFGSEIKTTQFFNEEGAADGIGPAAYLRDGFKGQVGTVVGPFTIGNQVFLAKVVEKKPADMQKLAAERDTVVLALKRKRAAERRELFEDGLVTQLVKEGKVKKYTDNINRVVANYRA